MRKMLLSCVLTSLIGLAGLPASGAGRTHTVLVVYSNVQSLPADTQVDEKLRETLAVNTSLGLNYQTEYLDYPRYGEDNDRTYDKLVDDFLRAKYAGKSIDVIVAVGPEALLFLRRHQDDLFVGIPVLGISVRRASYEDQLMPVRFLITPITIEARPTLELAMRLQPNAREIVVVTGASNYDLGWEKNTRRALTEWRAHPPVRYLSGLPLSDLLNELAHLPQNTIVYSPAMQRDGSGNTYTGRDVVRRMAEVSSAPLYSCFGTTINFGIVGGYVLDMADVGTQAGQVVRRILAGEKLTQKDMPDGPPSHYVVDWNQLKRWHLPEANLPPGTAIVNREPGPWEKYKRYILGTVGLVLLQSLLIFYLLAERRRRRRTQKELAERLRFETMVAQVSSEFANLESGRIDEAILHSLQRVQEFFRPRTAAIWRLHDAGSRFVCTHQWPENTRSDSLDISQEVFLDTLHRLSLGESVLFSGEFKLGQQEDAHSFLKAEMKSLVAIPIQSENHLLGALSLVNFEDPESWPADITLRLSTIADILGGALARQYSSEALRESEVLKGVILDYMQSNVAVVDQDGVVLEVNQHWIDSASRDAALSPARVGVGVNYLEVCRAAIGGEGAEGAMDALYGIESVLTGARDSFDMEYPCPSPTETRWFRMTAMRLPRASGGVLIIHMDMTPEKRAQLERKRMQEETSQLNRATEMGQLVASLAHELAQPLAAVLSNAQAASRLSARPDPDLAEIQTALLDIIEDDQRASAVLNNVRALLRKHSITPHRVNLNEIVKNVTLMVKSSAQLRGIQIWLVLSEEAVLVMGDEVPLQQVLLNLINNAMDAVTQLAVERRTVTLRTAVRTQDGSGLLVVEDQGPGVPDDLRAKLFQPFFTTKGEGLGMGLAICQTILQTLGGSIELQNRPDRGATFQVMLRPAS
jgi:signal transduction histidine kinase